MASLYVLVVLVALAGVALVQPESFDGNGWKKALTAERKTSILDGDDNPLAYAYAKLYVYGDFNRSTDNEIIQSFVSSKLSMFEHQPEEALKEVYNGERSLPLLFNVTLAELINAGPKSQKNTALKLKYLVYAKKKHCHDAAQLLKSLSSSF